MITTADRVPMKAELVANGYAWNYLDTWQPKITLYRHAPGLTVTGELAFPVGTPLPQLPGEPSYVLKMARNGMLPYPPTGTCECRWCVERTGGVDVIKATKDIAAGIESDNPDMKLSTVTCQECGYEAKALTELGAISKLRIHTKAHEVTSTV